MTPETRKHQKVTSYSKADDGTVHIEQKSYYEELAQIVEEVEKPMVTSAYTLEQDVIHALKHLEDGALRLTLTIDTKNGQPTKLVKRYVTMKQRFNKR